MRGCRRALVTPSASKEFVRPRVCDSSVIPRCANRPQKLYRYKRKRSWEFSAVPRATSKLPKQIATYSSDGRDRFCPWQTLQLSICWITERNNVATLRLIWSCTYQTRLIETVMMAIKSWHGTPARMHSRCSSLDRIAIFDLIDRDCQNRN